MENCHNCIRNKKTVTMVFHSTLALYELSLDYIINHAFQKVRNVVKVVECKPKLYLM